MFCGPATLYHQGNFKANLARAAVRRERGMTRQSSGMSRAERADEERRSALGFAEKQASDSSIGRRGQPILARAEAEWVMAGPAQGPAVADARCGKARTVDSIPRLLLRDRITPATHVL